MLCRHVINSLDTSTNNNNSTGSDLKTIIDEIPKHIKKSNIIVTFNF